MKTFIVSLHEKEGGIIMKNFEKGGMFIHHNKIEYIQDQFDLFQAANSYEDTREFEEAAKDN
eukprot:Awhi_evm1s12753